MRVIDLLDELRQIRTKGRTPAATTGIIRLRVTVLGGARCERLRPGDGNARSLEAR
jgi:hypothetical protein